MKDILVAEEVRKPSFYNIFSSLLNIACYKLIIYMVYTALLQQLSVPQYQALVQSTWQDLQQRRVFCWKLEQQYDPDTAERIGSDVECAGDLCRPLGQVVAQKAHPSCSRVSQITLF